MGDVQTIYRRTSIARCDYECQASLFLQEPIFDIMHELTFAQKRAIVIARSKGWKILKGEQYIYQFNKQEGLTFYFRAIPAIHQICVQFDLYQV
jgi:hypothetical protein